MYKRQTMKNPISLRNRVVIMPSVNSFFSYFMGIRYLVASADRLPPGYSAVFPRDGYALAENPNVRPMVYGSWDLDVYKRQASAMPYEKSYMYVICVPAPSAVGSPRSVDFR